MNWTQPICQKCWDTRFAPREPVRLRFPEMQKCCYCGEGCTGDIWIRVDPRTVPYPTDKDD